MTTRKGLGGVRRETRWSTDPKIIGYTDFGPRPTAKWPTEKHKEWRARPYCDLCDAQRGRYLRRLGDDDFGSRWRCIECDNENFVE